MNSMSWGHGWHEMKIDFWWADPQRGPGQALHWEPVPIEGRDHAIWLLGNAGDSVQAMRAMLADGSISMTRASDRSIVETVAQKLADGYLRLFRSAMPLMAALPHMSTAAASPKTAPRPIAVAKKAATAAPLPSAQPAQQATPAAIIPDFPLSAQDAQATALRKAAATGVPFCAVCEELKRKRAAAQSPAGGA